MIIEGLLTTCDESGVANIAPMGPTVVGDFEALSLRPFPGSTTHRNLSAHRCGVFHVVDDVSLLAESAVGPVTSHPELVPAVSIRGRVLQDCCRWFEFVVRDIDESAERTKMMCEITHRGKVRDYLGFNRARNAVVECAILATRIHFLPPGEVLPILERLHTHVTKTGDADELEAFALLDKHVRRYYDEQS